MTASEAIHDAIKDHEEFSTLLEKVDTPDSVDELRAVLDYHGDATNEAYDHSLQELDLRELGWLRVAWEAHHNSESSDRVETAQ